MSSIMVGDRTATGWGTLLRAGLSRSGLAFCLVLWLAQRVVVQGIGLTVNAVRGPAPHAGPGFFGEFANWDSGWFSCIIRSGYFGPACSGGQTLERLAFFPLYPASASGVAWLAGGGDASPTTIAFGLWAVSAVASLAAVVALFALVEHTRGAQAARRASALLLFGPYAVFLVASYSESLYLAAAIGAWYACQRRRYALTAVLGIVATLTRASGLFLVPALLVLYVTTTLREKRRLRWSELVLVGSSGFGVVGYFVWLWARTGDLFAWSHAQEAGWNRTTRWPWDTLLNQGVHVLREPRWDWQIQAVIEVVFAVGLVLAVLLLLRARDWPAATLVALTALSLMTSNSYLSLARNTLTLFPLLLLVVDLKLSRRRFTVVLVAGLVLFLFNTVQLAAGNWAD